VFGALTLTASRIVIAAVLGTITLALTGQRSWPGRSQIAGILVMGAGLAVGYPGFLALAVGQVPAYHAAVVIGLVRPSRTAVRCIPLTPGWVLRCSAVPSDTSRAAGFPGRSARPGPCAGP
jgi:hypothetical protein